MTDTALTGARTALALVLAATLAAAPAAAQTTEEPAAGTEEAAPAAGAEEGSDDAAGAADDAALADLSADDVVATVGDTEITLGELIALRQAQRAEYQNLPDEVLTRGLLDQLVNQTLLAEAAREAGLAEEPAVALRIENQTREILADAYLSSRMRERMTMETLRERYEAQIAGAEPVEEIRASHILVEDKALAEEIRAELDEGADFAALAAEHGTDGTASRGGDLGYFARDDMVPEFAEAAFAIEEAGDVAGPVESPFGWHLIKLADRRERPAPPFEEVVPELAQELGREVQLEILQGLEGDTEIEMAEPAVPAAAIRADRLLEKPAE